ncbi:MAG: MFS transporter [Candidatus Krumholzibacteriia bacterium]
MPTDVARTTARRYWLGMVFQGLWATGQILFPFVLAKSLAAPAWLVTLSVLMESTGMVAGLYWSGVMQSGGRRRALFWGGLCGRVVVAAALWITTPGLFVAMLAVVYLFGALVYPAQNSILQENIPADRRGWVFGRGAMVQQGTAVVCSFVVGLLLDHDPMAYRIVYPVLGVLGFGYPLALATLPRPAAGAVAAPGPRPAGPLAPPAWRSLASAVSQPFLDARDTFRRDRAYLWYQANFTVYGVAFIMLVPVVPLYFTSELHLAYRHIAQSRILIGSLGVGLLGPLAGKLMDRLHPTRLCAMSFGWVALYPLMLAAGPALNLTATQTAYAAFVIYSVGMAGVNVTWNVGSMAFAPPGQGGHYQGIHVAMVGLRGVLAPILGYLLLTFLGFREVFLVAACLFLAAAVSSAVLARRVGGHPAQD